MRQLRSSRQISLPPPPALAQSNSAAPANVAARNGANTGEAIVSWTPNAAAVSNRVGWANYAEVQTARDAGNWLEAFNFVEIGAAKTSYTVKRLEPGAQHAFIVATIAANGAATYSGWVFLTTAGGQHPGFCPVTGLLLGDGYKEIGDRTAGTFGAFTLSSVTYPGTIRYSASGTAYLSGEGRQFVKICGVYENTHSTLDGFFLPGTHILTDSDTGIGFAASAYGDTRPANVPPETSRSFCMTWEMPADARTIIVAVRLGFDQSDIHLYRVDREQ